MTTATLTLSHQQTLKMAHGGAEEDKPKKSNKSSNRAKAPESSRYPAEDSDLEDDEDEYTKREPGDGYDLPSFMVGQFPRIRIMGRDGNMQDISHADVSERTAARTAAIRSARHRSSSKSHVLRKKLTAEILAAAKKKKENEKQQIQKVSESSHLEERKRGPHRSVSDQSQQLTRAPVRTLSSSPASLLMQPPDRSKVSLLSSIAYKRSPAEIKRMNRRGNHEHTKVWLEQAVLPAVLPAVQKHQNQASVINPKPELKRAVSYREPTLKSKRVSPEDAGKQQSLKRSDSYRGPAVSFQPDQLDRPDSPTKREEERRLKMKRSQSYRGSGFAPRLATHVERGTAKSADSSPTVPAKPTIDRRPILRCKPREFSLEQLEIGHSFAEPRHLYFTSRRISKRFLLDATITKTETPAHFLPKQSQKAQNPNRRPLPDVLLDGLPASSRPSTAQWYSCPECQHRMACLDGTVALRCSHCRTVLLPH